MFETSGDILNIVLSVCAAVLTIFLCAALYYFVASIQRFYKIIRRVEGGVAKAEELIEIAREKLKNSRAYFMILGEIAKKAMDFVQEKRDKKAASGAKKK